MIGLLQLLTSSLFAMNLDSNLKRRRRLWLRFDEIDTGIIPGWTLAIPVRNEAENLKRLRVEFKDQRYLPEQILFLNDQSEDASSEVIASIAHDLKNSVVSEIQGQPLPEGWRGKIWALDQLLGKVGTPFVMFMDADVVLRHPNSFKALFRDVMPIIERQESNFASVFPRADVDSSTALVVDQVYMHLFFFLPFFWSKMKSASAAAGCGQMMLMNVEKIRERGYLKRIAGSTHDGLQLARAFKEDDRQAPFFDGASAFACQYYESPLNAFRGLSRNAWEADGNVLVSVIVSILFFWNFVLPFVLLPFLVWNPAFLAAFLAMLWAQLRLAEELDLGRAHVFMTPVKALAAVGVHLWSPMRMKLGVEQKWRGRNV